MNNEKMEYTWWLYLIGGLGVLLGSQVGVWFAIGAKSLDEISIIHVFLLATAILFLFVKREMTYLMYTGMFAVHCVWFTFTILMLMPPVPDWMVLISVPFWLCLGYFDNVKLASNVIKMLPWHCDSVIIIQEIFSFFILYEA